MKSIDVYGFGNGIVDVLVEVEENEFSQLGFEKGTMNLLEPEHQAELLSRFSDRDCKLVSGGSVANSIVLLAQLGAKTAFSCRLADDTYGMHYQSEFESHQVQLASPFHVGGKSGTSVILITPDAERTMRTSLGVSGDFGPEDLEEEFIRQSHWIFIEGYLFCNPERGHAAVRYAIELAKKHDTKIAITLSDGWIVNDFREEVEYALSNAHLIFVNETEAKVLTGCASGREAFEQIQERYASAAVTLGGEGVLVHSKDVAEPHVPAVSVEPMDLTGAGDAFAGGYLFGLVRGEDPINAAKGANFLAAQVIKKVGARIHGDPQELWQSALL